MEIDPRASGPGRFIFQGDPEDLHRIIAHAQLLNDLLVLDNRGVLARLSALDGTVVWRTDVPAVRSARLFAATDVAALEYVSAGKAALELWHFGRAEPQRRLFDLGETEPTRFWHTPCGLIALWPDGLERFDLGGRVRFAAPPVAEVVDPLRLTVVTSATGDKAADSRPNAHPARTRVMFATQRGGVWEWDAADPAGAPRGILPDLADSAVRTWVLHQPGSACVAVDDRGYRWFDPNQPHDWRRFEFPSESESAGYFADATTLIALLAAQAAPPEAPVRLCVIQQRGQASAATIVAERAFELPAERRLPHQWSPTHWLIVTKQGVRGYAIPAVGTGAP